jgi:hypothetical protein
MQTLVGGRDFASPLLSYLAVRCLSRQGYWLAPAVYTSYLNKVRFGLQLTLLGCIRRSWLVISDDLRPPDDGKAAGAATGRLELLRKEWLCRDRPSAREAVFSTFSRVWLLAEKCKKTWHGAGLVNWDRNLEVLSYGATRLRMSEWRALIADLKHRCTHRLQHQLLFGLLLPTATSGHRIHLPRAADLQDDWNDLVTGHSFNHPKNAEILRGWDTWLMANLETQPAVRKALLHDGHDDNANNNSSSSSTNISPGQENTNMGHGREEAAASRHVEDRSGDRSKANIGDGGSSSSSAGAPSKHRGKDGRNSVRPATSCPDNGEHPPPGAAPPLRWNAAGIRRYLAALDDLLRDCLVLVHLTAGLPGRGPEFMSITYCNTSVPRTILILDGQALILTGYHKGRWRMGARGVARYLPAPVGDLIVQIVSMVLPFARLLRAVLRKLEQGALSAAKRPSASGASAGASPRYTAPAEET